MLQSCVWIALTLAVGASLWPAPCHAGERVVGVIATVAGVTCLAPVARGEHGVVSAADVVGTAPMGDGGLATEAKLWLPTGAVHAPDGNLYIADARGTRIRRVDASGIITTVAELPEDVSPLWVSENSACPNGLALGPDGSLYVPDPRHSRVCKVDLATGTVSTVAGIGRQGYTGDGGPATHASLGQPCGVGVASDGTLYIADLLNHRIRKVDPSGVITTVAGDGWKDERGFGRYAGDGDPATSASFNAPYAVALGGDGRLYIADANNQRIRRVSAVGVITTFAGGGNPRAYPGDRLPATKASLYWPTGLATGPYRSVYIADTMNRRIRRVNDSGVIMTVAGNGIEGFGGDGGPATRASLGFRVGVSVDADCNVFIADTYNHRIRKVDPAGIITTVAGSGPTHYSN